MKSPCKGVRKWESWRWNERGLLKAKISKLTVFLCGEVAGVEGAKLIGAVEVRGWLHLKYELKALG